MKKYRHNQGSVLIFTIVFTTIFIIILSGLVSLVLLQQRVIDNKIASERGLQIAEAGINYYRWHLSHAVNDYADGTDQDDCDPCGPYQHSYVDPWGGTIGTYELSITPPPEGSDVVTVQASGWVNNFPNQKRSVEVQFRRPSLVRYMVVANSDMRFGTDTDVYGEIHSNGGVRFDGVAHNVVTSARNTYSDPDEAGLCTLDPLDNNKCPGVWTAQANPNNVFLAGTDYPVPVVDFDGITADLSDLKDIALNNATEINTYLWIGDGVYLEPSDKEGYLLQFEVVSGVTQVDIYRVKKVYSDCCWWSSTGWTCAPTHRIQTTSSVANDIAIPASGVIFVEDNAWVAGPIYNTGVTVVAAAFPDTPATNKSIYINNDIIYSGSYDTSKLITTLGLIAQKDISIGLNSEDNLEIHAALLAQKGRIGREYYPSSCDSTYYKRTTITVRGTMATYNRYGFSWICQGSWCSGYHYRNLIFNDQLRVSPPPHYPVAGEYTFLNWREVLPD